MATRPSLPFSIVNLFFFLFPFHFRIPVSHIIPRVVLEARRMAGNPVTFNEDKRSLVYWNFPKDKVKRVQCA